MFWHFVPNFRQNGRVNSHYFEYSNIPQFAFLTLQIMGNSLDCRHRFHLCSHWLDQVEEKRVGKIQLITCSKTKGSLDFYFVENTERIAKLIFID